MSHSNTTSIDTTCILLSCPIPIQASFSADGSTDISIDDPDFWQKWAQRAKLDLDDLANKVIGNRLIVYVEGKPLYD